jgi:uncharacterized protein (TIGR02391 family)
MKHWLPWSELNESPRLTAEEFRTALRDYPRSAILIACARFSTIFKFGPEANTVASQEINEYWVPRLMRPDLVDKAMQEVKNGRPIFFQGQLRFLAAEAMRLDPAPAENGSQVPDWALGGLLLGAGELLYRKHVADLPDELDVMANLVADFLPTFEIDSITDPFLLFLRFYIYLTVIIPRLPEHLRIFDVAQEFEKVFGFPLKLYSQFVYAFTLHAMTERNQIKIGNVAFREVEIAVRDAGRFPADLVGVELMRQAFRAVNRPNQAAQTPGPLTDANLPVAEQEGMAHLFAGAIGLYKNPQSHRYVPTSAAEAAEVVLFASHLLRIVDRVSSSDARS